MGRCSPFVIRLSDGDRSTLERRARSYSALHAEVVRARIVLLAADGWTNIDIAEELGVQVDVVSRWRKRCHDEGDRAH